MGVAIVTEWGVPMRGAINGVSPYTRGAAAQLGDCTGPEKSAVAFAAPTRPLLGDQKREGKVVILGIEDSLHGVVKAPKPLGALQQQAGRGGSRQA